MRQMEMPLDHGLCPTTRYQMVKSKPNHRHSQTVYCGLQDTYVDHSWSEGPPKHRKECTQIVENDSSNTYPRHKALPSDLPHLCWPPDPPPLILVPRLLECCFSTREHSCFITICFCICILFMSISFDSRGFSHPRQGFERYTFVKSVC